MRAMSIRPKWSYRSYGVLSLRIAFSAQRGSPARSTTGSISCSPVLPLPFSIYFDGAVSDDVTPSPYFNHNGARPHENMSSEDGDSNDKVPICGQKFPMSPIPAKGASSTEYTCTWLIRNSPSGSPCRRPSLPAPSSQFLSASSEPRCWMAACNRASKNGREEKRNCK